MSDQVITTTQASFAGALNAVSAPSVLAADEVQSSTNVDFGLESGAASSRRGSLLYVSGGTGGIALIARNYGLSTGVWDDTLIPWFGASQNGETFLASGSGPGLTFAKLGNYEGGASAQIIPAFTQYEGYTYIANGSSAFRTNGSRTVDWLLPQADTPHVTIDPQFGSFSPLVGFDGLGTHTYSATEGAITGSSTTTIFDPLIPVILTTCATGTGSRIVLVGTCTNTNWENPLYFNTPPTGTALAYTSSTFTIGGASDFHQGWPNGDTTGASGPYVATSTATQTLTLGNYGTDYLLLALTDQQSVVTIQRDLSIGDTKFTNYWHSETAPGDINDSSIDPVTAMLESQGNATIEIQQASLNVNRGMLPRSGNLKGNSVAAFRRNAAKTTISASISPWGVSRGNYQFIGALSSPDFTNIKAIRVIIEYNTVGKVAVVGGCLTYGGGAFPLNDQAAGISYYQTYAHVENGVIVAEGTPSNPSPPQRCQFAHAELSCALATNTTAGITHRVFYRTGGLLSDAYRVGSCTITGGTATIYDYGLPDMLIINNPIMKRYLWSQWPSPTAGVGLPGVNALSLPWQDRVWVGVGNQLYWSYPGQLTQIQEQSQTTVGDSGDSISAIIPAQNLVIVNQASVFEMAGSVFEGTSQNWTLTRTQARRGSAAPRTAINTPLGVLLLGYDGISFYRQGFGVDQELQWIYERIGDLWKGNGASDPAGIKGRIPALNPLTIFNSCAAYKDGRVYLAVPTGTSTYANTVFVLDVAHEKVWMYTYPFAITSLMWDRVGNRLMAGTDVGTIQQLEVGLVDHATDGTASGVGWSYTTRQWSVPVDRLMENLQVDNMGTFTVLAEADNTNTYNVGTVSSTYQNWSPLSLQGTMVDNVDFILSGTASGTQQAIYGLEWDALPEGKKLTFFQSDPVAVPSESYVKTWLVDVNPCIVNGTFGTVTGSVLVDGLVVQTGTFTSLVSATDVLRRKVFEVGLPNVTYGKTISAVYNSTGAFRHYSTQWEMEPKPFGKLTWLVTYKKAGGVTQADMARFFAMDIEGAATNTLTCTWIIDGTAFSTNTLIFGATDAGEESGRVRNYMDWISFPPGGRGYLFQQQLTATVPFKVWRASLDIDRIGIKGLSRVTLNGTPDGGQ